MKKGIIFVAILASMIHAGCATKRAGEDPFMAPGLVQGDQFQLKEDAFLYERNNARFIVPQESKESPFSVAQFRTSPDEIKNAAKQYVVGVVPKGTQFEFRQVDMHVGDSMGLSLLHIGIIISGPFKGDEPVVMSHALYEGNLNRGLSSRYLKRTKKGHNKALDDTSQ